MSTLPPSQPNIQPVPEPNAPWPNLRALLTGIVIGCIYLALFRFTTYIPYYQQMQKGGALLMSFSFLFLAPFVSGLLTIYRKPAAPPLPIWSWFVAPWITVIVSIVIAFFAHWEGLICVIFILPVALVSASMGGFVAGLWHDYAHRRIGPTTLSCIALAPLLLAMVEVTIHQPLITRTVETEVTIHAPASVIWHNIERVPAISPTELRPSWANRIGFPRPVEATLSHEGVGGVRNASFERGLTFTETVTDWQPLQHLAFTIQADTSRIPSTTLDEHVTVGGRFFDVLNGSYTIEPLADGSSILHLSSQERLSTDFNPYAALWSNAVMTDMQTNILHVIQNRCEHAATASLQRPTAPPTPHTPQTQ